jgi:hypothetical protein
MTKSAQPFRTIGGYMCLQLLENKSYHPSLLALNTARNSLEYILRVKGYTTIYIPYFTCGVLLEPIEKLGLKYHFYAVDQQLNPVVDYQPAEDTCLLYTNYFGLKTDTVLALSKSIQNLIIDNAQAFYAAPVPGIDTFYSCRKFFGVSDGAYLSIAAEERLELDTDASLERFSHLIKSLDQGIEAAYPDFVRNDDSLMHNNIRSMSPLTQKILSGIDYRRCAEIRRENYAFLHAQLSGRNELQLECAPDEVPMVYPFLIDQPDIRQKLIQQKIFVATYWPNVYEWAQPDSFDYYLTRNMVPLPIDHRYNLDDMQYLVHTLNAVLAV